MAAALAEGLNTNVGGFCWREEDGGAAAALDPRGGPGCVREAEEFEGAAGAWLEGAAAGVLDPLGGPDRLAVLAAAGGCCWRLGMVPVRDSDPDPELDSATAWPAEIGGESALI